MFVTLSVEHLSTLNHAASKAFVLTHNRILRGISLCSSGRGGKTPGPEIPEVPGSNPGWSDIFRNLLFTVFSGGNGYRCKSASIIVLN